MKAKTIRIMAPLALAMALAGCGGGDTATDSSITPTIPEAPATVTCDTTLFVSGTVIVSPTAAQLAPYAKTYTDGTSTLVLNADGTATYNGAALDLKSICYEESAAGKPVYLHWGIKETAGAGSFYDNHVDLWDSGLFSGYINEAIFSSPK
jgi:hypothetical protein